jgi:K+-sensing histidine kinase KdpD
MIKEFIFAWLLVLSILYYCMMFVHISNFIMSQLSDNSKVGLMFLSSVIIALFFYNIRPFILKIISDKIEK